MGIFNRIKQARQPAAKEKEEVKAKPEAAKEPDVRVTAPKEKVAKYGWLLTSPRISEKAAVSASKGAFVFNVPVEANKTEVAKAVEALYKVEVIGVRTMRGIGKTVRRGRIAGRRNRWKKAVVTLKKGQKIDLYEGV